MDEVLAFFKDCKTFFIATTEGDKPKVRPFGFIMQFEGKLYFTTGNQKPFFKQIQANPFVEMCGMNEKFEWVRLSGKAVIDPRFEPKKKAFEVMPAFENIYKTPENPLFECFYIEEAQASFCTMTAPPRVVEL